MLKNIVQDFRKLRQDKSGIYVIAFSVVLVFILAPAIAIMMEINNMHMSQAEAQVITDGAGLSIVNESPLDFQDFEVRNVCDEVTYQGSEYYLDYIGDSGAYNKLQQIYNLNKHYLSSIENYEFVVRDEYKPASNTNTRIPDSIKQQAHDPVLYLEVTYKYESFIPFIRKDVKITTSTVVEKHFDADLAREEYNFDAPLACLKKNDTVPIGGDKGSSSSGSSNGGFNLDDFLNSVKKGEGDDD